MKKFVFRFLTVLFFTFLLMANTKAQLLTDDFNYSGLLTDNGWSVHSGTGNALTTTTGLTYANYTGSGVGNAVLVGSFSASSQDVNRGFTEQNTDGTSIYYSFLVNISDTASTKSGDYFFHIGDRASGTSFTTFSARVFVKVTSNDVNFGISNTTVTYGTTNFSKNTTYLLIVKYTISTSGNDEVKLWVRSSGIPATELDAGTPEVTNSSTAGQNVIDAVGIRQGSANQPVLVVDGIRIGTAWTDLFPAADTPSLTVNPTTLESFSFIVGSGPSTSQSYDLSGSDLNPASGNIVVTGSTNYEVSTDNVSFSGSVNVAYTAGTLNSTPVYVRLKQGLSFGQYNGEVISNSGGTAATQNVTCSGEVISALPVTETFNYSTGSNLTSNGWIAHSGAGNLPIIVNASSLSYTGYVNSGLGKSVTLSAPDTASAEDDKRVFSSVTENSIYASFLINVNSATDSSVYFVHFGEGSSTSLFFGKIFIKNNGSNFAFGVAKRNNADAVFTAYSYSPSVTYLVVVKYTFNSGTTSDDEVKLWVNPAMTGTEPASTLTQTDGGADANDLSFLALRQGAYGPALTIGGLRIATSWLPAAPGVTFSSSYTVQNGWNLVSFPSVHPNSMSVDTLYRFRDVAANVFWFDGSNYIAEDPLGNGKGYWMKHNGQRLYNWNGTVQSGVLYPQLTQAEVVPFSAAAGWNLFGAYDYTFLTSALSTSPSGLINGFPYSYTSGVGYQIATSIEPSKGYFVNLTGAGNIIFPPRASAPPKLNTENIIKNEWAKIIIKDAAGKQYTLYSANDNTQLEKFILPPKPPVGLFDVRFTTDRLVENLTSEKSFEITGVEYPVIISVSGMNAKIKDAFTGELLNSSITDGGQVVINNSSLNKFTIQSDISTPVEYELAQNYPNPFNPSTTIKFSLAQNGFVTLKIYDVIGNEVATLVNEEKQTGNYEMNFNASSLASGVYFYKIKAGDFVSTKKMLLLK